MICWFCENPLGGHELKPLLTPSVRGLPDLPAGVVGSVRSWGVTCSHCGAVYNLAETLEGFPTIGRAHLERVRNRNR